MDVIGHLEREWLVFSGAPVLVIGLVVVVWIVIWRLFAWARKAEIDGLKAHIGALEARGHALSERIHNLEERVRAAREIMAMRKESEQIIHDDLNALRPSIAERLSAEAGARARSATDHVIRLQGADDALAKVLDVPPDDASVAA
jgi:hypothetical protein